MTKKKQEQKPKRTNLKARKGTRRGGAHAVAEHRWHGQPQQGPVTGSARVSKEEEGRARVPSCKAREFGGPNVLLYLNESIYENYNLSVQSVGFCYFFKELTPSP